MDKPIEFLRTKDYKFIREVGQGGTGRTVLLLDELINEYFVCKKYSPFYDHDKLEYYKNFVDEIKLLHLLYHKNIVRVFNYYLYPEQTTGYILMEFIEGTPINQYIKNNPDKLNDVFIQTVSAFRHLEENGILHRDIRPENIMVTTTGTVKIIDFGFGKQISFDAGFDNSISLNWRYTPPIDFTSKIYDFKTEIYFIGKLFEEIIQENNLQNFAYSNALILMIKPNYEERIISFFEIDRSIITEDSLTIDFSDAEKDTYKRFASNLRSLYSKIELRAEYLKDPDQIIKSLEDVYRNSMLEDYVQNPILIARAFVRGQYYYNSKTEVSVSVLKDFMQLLKSTSTDKKRIILNNLWQRLDSLNRYDEESDDLPF